MTFSVLGLALGVGHSLLERAVSRVVIGRAVKLASSRARVTRVLVDKTEIDREIKQVYVARAKAMTDLQQLQQTLKNAVGQESTREAATLVDVHLMLLEDDTWMQGVEQYILQQRYNAQWAVSTQFMTLANQFDEMSDAYMRERKHDIEQVAERVLKYLQNSSITLLPPHVDQQETFILIAHDLSPADMMRFKQEKLGGLVLESGGTTSHTAIVARGMDIPVILGVKHAMRLIQPHDCLILDADLGAIVVDPTQAIMSQYQDKYQRYLVRHQAQKKLSDVPSVQVDILTPDGEMIALFANIEHPNDVAAALAAGARGIGLFRTEFLFMGHPQLPSEDEQYVAYSQVLQAMQGRPVTIRTLDIGADKPLDVEQAHVISSANPALGLRAIRWCLAKPDIFMTQLRALLRAAVHGRLNILIPMLTNRQEIKQCLQLIACVKAQLEQAGLPYGSFQLGAMIEVPAAALCVSMFFQDFDFLSIGSNDLIQYTLAVDRTDESVAHLYDASHPAVQYLLEQVIQQCRLAGKPVSLCGAMAMETIYTQALLQMGLRSFSMPSSHISAFKEHLQKLVVI